MILVVHSGGAAELPHRSHLESSMCWAMCAHHVFQRTVSSTRIGSIIKDECAAGQMCALKQGLKIECAAGQISVLKQGQPMIVLVVYSGNGAELPDRSHLASSAGPCALGLWAACGCSVHSSHAAHQHLPPTRQAFNMLLHYAVSKCCSSGM